MALISPVFVTLLLTKVSGVPLLEKKSDTKWGGQADYEAYKKNTPVLIPKLQEQHHPRFSAAPVRAVPGPESACRKYYPRVHCPRPLAPAVMGCNSGSRHTELTVTDSRKLDDPWQNAGGSIASRGDPWARTLPKTPPVD